MVTTVELVPLGPVVALVKFIGGGNFMLVTEGEKCQVILVKGIEAIGCRVTI